MSVEENKAVARRWNEEIFSSGNIEAFGEVLAKEPEVIGGTTFAFALTQVASPRYLTPEVLRIHERCTSIAPKFPQYVYQFTPAITNSPALAAPE